MSRPGELRDDELTVIGTGIGTKPARLANVAAAWYAKADAELRERFGFGIEYRSTGAYRTNADTAAIPGALPDGDHERGIALDIRNWSAFAAIDRDDFVAILERNGWRNIDSTGKPFPREPWHHVCTKTEPPGGDERGNIVWRLVHLQGSAFVCRVDDPTRRVRIDPAGDNYHLRLLTRFDKSTSAGDPMLPGELEIVASYLRRIGLPLGGGGDGLTAAEVADEIDERARKRLG